ncbi:Interferon beta-3, partial [Eschrichtius robustus]|nr:Interferon beta-3 [Eschrichtius robustus]
MDFEVPEEIKQPQQFQKEDAVLVIYEMLQQIFGILRRNFSSTGWTETITENLLVEVYGQMDRLETILEEIMEKENFTGVYMTILHLKKYYLQIVQYLKSKEYSNCAWTVEHQEAFPIQWQVLPSFQLMGWLSLNPGEIQTLVAGCIRLLKLLYKESLAFLDFCGITLISVFISIC